MTLQQYLNPSLQTEFTYTDLAYFLNGLAHEENTVLLQKIARVLNQTTYAHFLREKNGVVLHLAPYNTNLLNKINIDKILEYISNDEERQPAEQLILLTTVMNHFFLTQRFSHISVLYAKILDLVIANGVLQGEELLAKLSLFYRKVSAIRLYLDTRINNEINAFNLFMQNMLHSGDFFNEKTYNKIHLYWDTLKDALALMRTIRNNTTSFFPQNINELRYFIINLWAEHDLEQFSLTHMLNIMLPEVPLSTTNVQQQTHFLLGMLLEVYNECIWQKAIKVLSLEELWLQTPYAGQAFLERIVEDQNKRLLFFLCNEGYIAKEHIAVLLTQSLAKKRWETLVFLLSLDEPLRAYPHVIMDTIAKTIVQYPRWQSLFYIHNVNRFFLSSAHFIVPVKDFIFLLISDNHAEALKRMLQRSENLEELICKAPLTDSDGRFFSAITPFQYALWAGKWNICMIMLQAIEQAFNKGDPSRTIKNSLHRHYMELLASGVSYQ